MRKRAVADVIGALFFIVVVFISMFSIMLVESYYFALTDEYHQALEHQGQFNKENISVRYVQALPPRGLGGIVVCNYGIPVIIEDLVTEQDGGLSFSQAGVSLGTGECLEFATQNPYSGVLTNYGALFMANSTTSLVPVSTIGVGVELSKPGGLYYVPSGEYWVIYSQQVARWYVNGTEEGVGRALYLYIDGPTTVAAIWEK
ncbi:MAG: hypothetical protein ACP5NC_07975 [Nitrososphaeria archaeon]